MLREIDGPVGRLEALLDEPAVDRGVSADGYLQTGRRSGLRAAVVLGHPHPQYGGTMHTKTIYQAANIDPPGEYQVGLRPVPRAQEDARVIEEILS